MAQKYKNKKSGPGRLGPLFGLGYSYGLAVLVLKTVFQVLVGIPGLDLDPFLIGLEPFGTDRRESLGQVGRYKGMYVQYDPVFGHAALEDTFDIRLDLVDEHYGCLHFGTTSIGVHLRGFDVHLRPYPLSGDLDESKLAGGQNLVLCTVFLHLISEVVEEFS